MTDYNARLRKLVAHIHLLNEDLDLFESEVIGDMAKAKVDDDYDTVNSCDRIVRRCYEAENLLAQACGELNRVISIY